jgi:hypothetical protein
MHFSTPNYLNKVNVQKEFNFHNIEVFNTGNFDGSKKTGIQRLLEINFLFITEIQMETFISTMDLLPIE